MKTDNPIAAYAFTLTRAFMASQMIFTACRFGIPDLLSERSKSYSEIAATLGLPRLALRRFMRGLVLCQLVKEYDGDFYELTELGRCFLKSREGSLYGFATQNRLFYQAWSKLPEALSSEKTGFELHFGKSMFEFLESEREIEQHFHASMSTNILRLSPDLCKVYDFSEIDEIIDIGGSTGTLVNLIKSEFPSISMKVLDRESVISENAGRKDITYICGDFFKFVPPTSGMYILAHVLHDWNDQDCVTILENCEKGLKGEGRILVIELILPEKLQAYNAAVELDMSMLVLTGGRERTEAEYRDLFEKAGLVLVTVIPTVSGNSLMDIRRRGADSTKVTSIGFGHDPG